MKDSDRKSLLRPLLGLALSGALVAAALCVPAAHPLAAGPEAAHVATPCPDWCTGGFETGNLAKWSTTGKTEISHMVVHTGAHSVAMGGRNNALDTLSQTITVPYDLVHWSFRFYFERPPRTKLPAPTG